MAARDVLFDTLARRYAGATPEALIAVMCPLLVPIHSLDKNIRKVNGQNHYRATFWIDITEQNETIVQVGRTGKFVPSSYNREGAWKEIAKGRIIHVDHENRRAEGEIYTGESSRKSLSEALSLLSEDDFWEVDQYGASAKILSALAEHFLAEHAKERGYKVTRMPEDMAKHLGAYANFDFLFEKNGASCRVEVKSLWGTNTNYARLIHSTTTRPKGDMSSWSEAQKKNYYPTSSCKFATQDIFAVNLFLRTGNIRDFAFALSLPSDVSIHGLPRASKYPDHVSQNPLCSVDNTVWFDDLNAIWDLIPSIQTPDAVDSREVEALLEESIQETEPQLDNS